MKPARPLSLLTGVMLLGAVAAGARASASAGNPLWQVPLANLSGTRERPIFSASRRRPPVPPPPAPVAPVAVAPPPGPPQVAPPAVSLVGTIIGTGVSIGVFRETATKDVVRLRVGEDDQGWVLRLVKAGEVTLVNGAHAVVLTLPPPGQAPAGPPSVATLPIPVVSNENYVDEQPVPVRAPQRR
jgi:general secretion pathway protein N